MPALPMSNRSLLVRTDFTSDSDWTRLTDVIASETEDGFRAYFDVVDDPAFRGADWETLRAALPPNVDGASVLFIADAGALGSPGFPILVVDVMRNEPPFRCVAAELVGVDNNLNLSNMDWRDFASAVDEGGVFRGF